ncbi:MAG TPA: glycosyltransferase family 2 protein [Acidimicrobiales bacterium]|nr:glycosyltransferase family 2 protein [Acidimicrobiales bacterium]
MAEVDVVIVTYGGGADLPACVAAVRAQGPVVARIVVIDNASPDDTAARAEAIGGVEVVHNPRNVGYAAAMNQGYALTHAPYLLSLNADCELGDGYVAACVAALTANDRVAAVTGVLRLPDGRVDSTGIEFDGAYRARDRDRHAPVPSTDAPFGVSGAAALWRRAALDAIGPKPWWEWLFVYWDDVEIAWRLRDHGWSFACVPGASAVHRRGSDTADPDFVESQSLRNRLATIARHTGRAGLVHPRSAAVSVFTIARLALRHPQALRRARPLTAVRVGLAERIQ